ncbi:unnamed protein product [Ixodes pacificus]
MESGDCAVEQQPQPTAETAAVKVEIAENTAQDSAPEGAAPQDSSNGSDGTAKGEKNDASDAAGVPAKTEKKGTYYCDVCDESVPESAENHLRRRKHTRLLERLEKYGSLEAIAATFKLVRCNICGTQSNTKEQLQYHLDGQKHRTRCLNLGISPTLTDLPPGMRQTRMPMHPPASRGGAPSPPAADAPSEDGTRPLDGPPHEGRAPDGWSDGNEATIPDRQRSLLHGQRALPHGQRALPHGQTVLPTGAPATKGCQEGEASYQHGSWCCSRGCKTKFLLRDVQPGPQLDIPERRAHSRNEAQGSCYSGRLEPRRGHAYDDARSSSAGAAKTEWWCCWQATRS